MVWPDLDQELLIWQPYLDISATPKGWYAATFFCCHSLQCYAWEVLLLDASSRCLKLQKMKEEITRWGRKFRRQTNWLQTGFQEACSKCFSQLENLFCWLFYCTILVVYLPAGSRRVWIITVLLSNGWPLPRRCSLDSAFLDLFLILWNLFLPHHDWDIMNAGCFSSLCTAFVYFQRSLFVKASNWW